MAAPRSSTDGARRAGRNVSHPLRRRSTRGPLESEEDPLSPQSIPDSPAATSPEQPVDATTKQSPEQTSAVPRNQSTPTVDLSFLQDRREYHKLPLDDIPQSFLESSNQPQPSTLLPELLHGGHFRRAADVAVQNLFMTPADEPVHILHLLYCRLACLILIGRQDLASDEAVPMYDRLSGIPAETQDLIPLVPWELRVLLVRLQLFAAQDGGRRGIMALYQLASEARSCINIANDSKIQAVWRKRLMELGLRVADALVEIGELETACRHLDTLHEDNMSEVQARKALLYMHLGNLSGAQTCIDTLTDQTTHTVLQTLLISIAGDASEGLHAWQRLAETDVSRQLATQNRALFLLYTGHITQARELLAKAVKGMPVNPTLLFNLSTIYELCSDKALLHKTTLAQDLAERKPTTTTGGWERSSAELKL